MPNDSMWDTTDVHSTTISDGSTVAPDYYGQNLRRALDQKVRKLRSLLTADEDISTELDRVVCRLMKLALRTSKLRQNPPPINWMQCKLFDLLSLTEKAVERRRRQFWDATYELTAIEYSQEKNCNRDITMENDSKFHHIMTEYEDLNLSPDKEIDAKVDSQICKYDDSEIDDCNASVTSNEFKDSENNVIKEKIDNNTAIKYSIEVTDKQIEFEETSEWNVCNMELALFPRSENKPSSISLDASSCSSSNIVSNKQEKTRNNSKKRINQIKDSNFLSRIESKVYPKTKSKSKLDSKHSIHKSSRTKILKKVSSKRSSILNLIKYDSVAFKTCKLKERKAKEHHTLQSTSSRPIPASLIELCDSKSSITNDMVESKSISHSDRSVFYGNIAATEESMFIGIITEEGEEIIAMRRHIGTSPDKDLSISDYDDVLETVINITKDDSFCYIPDVEKQDVQSQSIFLNDLNEPSTSKGIRHLSTDVQCGPDGSVTCAMLSATTSFANIPKLFSTGITIGQSTTNVGINNKEPCSKNTYNFGTYTELTESILTVCKNSIGIKIKDSNTYINDRKDCFTMTQEAENNAIMRPSRISETKLIKPISRALKIDDSGSEFCESVLSYVKSLSQLVTSSKNTSDFQIQTESQIDNNVVVKTPQTSYDRSKLKCGGIHVHSFKEKQVSEDVVYQGKWHQNPNLPNKTIRSFASRKSESLTKGKIINAKECEIKPSEMKRTKNTTSIIKPKCSNILNVLNGSLKKTAQNEINIVAPIKTIKKNVEKVASKLAVSSHISKHKKTIYTKKRTSIIIYNKEIPLQNGAQSYTHRSVKNYIPLYLRKKIKKDKSESKLTKKSENIIYKQATRPIMSKNNPAITNNFIKAPVNPLINNVNFMIFRNKVETENESSNIPLTTDVIKNDSINLTQSHSQHSSTCSSPNSVDTVRAVSTRHRIICNNNRNSTSSEKSNSGILEYENKSTKNKKKFSRRGKSIKKPIILSPGICDNKENVPESSKNTSNKNIEKKGKYAYIGRTKSIFMTQLTNNTSNIPLTSTSLSKTKTQPLTKSLKLTNINNTNEQTLKPTSASMFDKSSLHEKSVAKCFAKDDNVTSSDYVSDKDFVYETFKEPSSNNSLESDTFSTSNEPDDESLNNRKSVHNTRSSIISAIRQLIEDKLNLPENNSYDSNNSDSETVILSRDDLYVNNSNNSLSPTSINTVITNEDTCESASDIQYVNNIFSGISNENETIPTSVNAKPPATESDLLSLKSFASVSTSKFSEYYLADNELENTLPQDDINIHSVHDIFERKEQYNVTNIGGVLALQAFSGFSVNEPIVGDQPDFINFADSETGSIAFESARQAASEEIFVSGRSSDTYESCYFDDDAYVPNWLFNLMSQQQSAADSEAEEGNVRLPMPIVEPDFDMNGNVMEPGVGISAGAGDGRGMHSDHSQDSSGRGTSLSSSATSSGPQSEALLTDQSNFTAQVDYLREPANTSAMIGPINRPDVLPTSIAEDNNGDDASNRHRNHRHMINPVQLASDIDADVSSLDTDAVDSDS